MERNHWPPLEQVREWAARKLASGQVVPSSTGRYVNLIALIDEILVSQATANSEGQKKPGDAEALSPKAGQAPERTSGQTRVV